METGSGRMLGNRYRLGPLVGRGGMATVHAAVDIRLHRPVAVKLFHPPADDLALARLTAEAKTLAGLSHPGLLHVFDVSTSSGQPYLVMQLVRGTTLRALINRGPLEPVEVARTGARLADTLRYVHSKQVVHRDIKPSNVLLDRASESYLADFGIAKAIGAARLTSSGHCVGTAAYLAPEQVAGVEAGPASDIYSLGLVLLECLTGLPEYTGTEAEVAVARLTRYPHVPEGLPPALRRILSAMTARDPDDRPDAARCAVLFERFLADPTAAASLPPTLVDATPVPDPTTQVVEIAPAAPRSGRRWRLRHAAAALAVLASAGTAVLLLQGGAEPVPPDDRAGQPAGRPEVAPVVAVVPETAVGHVVMEPREQARSGGERAKDDRGEDKDKGKSARGKAEGKDGDKGRDREDDE